MITATRLHDFSCGHRVCGHENKCAHLHGHNYRVHFEVSATGLDALGRVLDFSVINAQLGQWLEQHWDHRMLIWVEDPWAEALLQLDPSCVSLLFNPTAENMALHLLHVVGPAQLDGTGCELISVCVEETRKCSATATLIRGPIE